MTRLLLLVLLAVAPLVAQSQRFTTGVEVVRVDALVTNRNRPVAGLGPGDFDLRDNGVPQVVTGVSREMLPLNVICALDVSGSVGGAPFAQLKDAMTTVVDALGSGDRAALVTFSDRLHVHSGLTGDRAALRALLADMKAGGTTALFDALFASLALRETDSGRTLLLVFGDGLDTASWLTARKVLDAARRTDVVIYPVMTRRPLPPVFGSDGRITVTAARTRYSEIGLGEKIFDRFAEETGGRTFQAAAGSLRSTFTQVIEEFRQRYVLTYTPSGVTQPGWHTLDVKLRGKSGEIKARRGYFAS